MQGKNHQHLEWKYILIKNSITIAEKIKEFKLKEIASEINIDFGSKKIDIVLDNKGLKEVHTSIGKIVERLNDKGFEVKGHDNKIVLNAGEIDFKALYKLKEKLKETIISGVKGLTQVVVAKRGKDYVIIASGSNLKDVLEIEAARKTIMNEINAVIENQGIDINERHLKLVADAMTSIGSIKGFTRMGIISGKASILARATFETPDKQFINATLQGARDELDSVI